jgi:hypothetical protein
MMVVRGGERVKVFKMQDYDFELLLQKNQVPCGVMFHKSGWEACGGVPESFRFGRQDWAFAVALGEKGYCGQRIPKPLYYYRREGQNRSIRNKSADWWRTFRRQMEERFPHLYRGERPMGCCGRKTVVKTAPKVGAQSVKMQALPRMTPGATGMVLVEYIGQNVGRGMFYGEETGARYTFKATRRVGYVDQRDLPALLEIMQGRRPAFRVYKPPKPAKVVEVPKPAVPAPVAELEPEPDELPAVEVPKPAAPDVAEMTVNEVRDMVGETDVNTLQVMLEAEEAGRNRKMVVKALKEALDIE